MLPCLPALPAGTIIEVNVSELGLVTPGGKVVWGKYAQGELWGGPGQQCGHEDDRKYGSLGRERLAACSLELISHTALGAWLPACWNLSCQFIFVPVPAYFTACPSTFESGPSYPVLMHTSFRPHASTLQ